MNTDYILPLNDPRAGLETVGGKGASLARLSSAGLPVPAGFHLTTAAYREFVAANKLQAQILHAAQAADPAQPATLEAASAAIGRLFASGQMPKTILEAITHAYGALPDDRAVAVRSSATAEDLPDLSFAGQQETYLNIRGAAAVCAAVQRCWASLWTARAIGYRAQHHIDHAAVSLAVVVQQLVPADAAGILFTAHPITGRRDQAMITAAWGLGEAIVGGLVTPDTLSVERATGRVLTRETADKQVMTLRTEAGTAEQPTPEALRRQPVLSNAQAAELARLGGRIEALYGLPMDIEWTLAGGAFAIVQARPITALPEAAALAPTEWRLPHGAYAMMRNNIVELMAEPLSPLFATLGLRAVNTSMHRVIDGFGLPGVLPGEPIITVNHYAYYNGSVKPWKALGLFLQIGPILRKMLTGAVERWTEAGRPRYHQIVADWNARDWPSFSTDALVDSARALTEAAIDAHLALLTGLIPAAWISEALFTGVYERLFRRRDDPPAAAFLLGFDSLPIRADKSLFALADWARQSPSLRDHLAHAPAAQLAREREAPATVPAEVWEAWRQRLDEHLRRFGHTLYDLDFANPLPADDPTPALQTLKLYLRGQGADPAARQAASAERREQAVRRLTERLSGWRLSLFRKVLTLAQKYAPLREDGLAEIGLAYPLLRRVLGEVGRRFVDAGVMAAPDDVYWLTEAEVRRAAGQLDAGQTADRLAGLIPHRRAEHQAALRLSPPLMLPQFKLFGVDLAALKRRRGRSTEAVITGVACSAGQVTGPVRVLRGPADFSQMQPGDILVAPITTPAWTPLFAMAGAVVTDIGGPLSHGSIVAREYGIPAVLGTSVATAKLHSGDTVTVDGTAGKVYLVSRGPAANGGLDWRPPNPKGVYMRTSVVDLMPNPLSPLFVSWGLPAMVAQIIPVGEHLTRSRPVLPADYFTAINSYAYMNAAFPARSWWWILTAMIPSYPRMLRIMTAFWRDEARPRYGAVARQWQGQTLGSLSTAALWRAANEVINAAMYYVGTLQFATMGASAGSEALLTRVYDRLAKRAGDPLATALLMGWDNIPVRAEKSLFDLAGWLGGCPELAAHVLATPGAALAEQLRAPVPPQSIPDADWQSLRQQFERHLAQFGHIIFELDFAQALPLDEPAPMLETVRLYLRGEGANPYERQHAAEARREDTAATMLARLHGWRRWVFEKALRWAQSLSAAREDALADIGLGYPVLRRMLGELGRRFVAAGAIRDAHDIYWLERFEVEAGVAQLERGATLADLVGRVDERRAHWERARQVAPPPMIPMKKRYLGFNTDIWLAASEANQASDSLKGVAASPGAITAPACVIHGPEELETMRPGTVLVAGTTTPAWTPLFAMAAGVVTDIGGPLSHGSIVAREYGIPAVMGTGVATKRIHTGDVITVDGSAGIVTLAHNGAGG